MSTSYERMILEMLRNPPDPNEPLPAANRREAIFGIAITFLILSWTAAIFRLYVRTRIVREPGWDDAAIVLAAILDMVATIFILLCVDKGGLGRHQLYMSIDTSKEFLRHFYVAHALYITNTAVIKISLLLQFLRIFKAGYMRMICFGLIGLISIWGIGFTIAGWFPCFPVRGYWDRTVVAKCYGFGFGEDINEFVAMYRAHSASNMVLDMLVFLTPLVLFGRPNLKMKSLLSMAGIFALGGVVVATSVWRLHVITVNQAGTYPYYDFTWHTPIMILLSCLEIDLAIMCASMPIFWPIIEKSFTAIFVQYEVNVTEERVNDEYGLAYELEHSKSRREGSLRSMSGTSVEELTGKNEPDASKAPKYSVGLDPLGDEVRNVYQTSVQTKPKRKWEI